MFPVGSDLLVAMGSGDEGSGGDVVAMVARAAVQARRAKRRAQKLALEAMAVKRVELKRSQPYLEKQRRLAAQKTTMRSFFQSTRHHGSGQPLALVLDGRMPFVPGAEEGSGEEYPDSDSAANVILSFKSERGVSFDTTVTPGSSSGSGNTVVLSSKSPYITLSSESEDPGNAGLAEIPEESEGEDEEVESPPKKKKKSQSAKSKAQKRYDRHRKFQTIWAAALPWAEPILASDGILHMVKCKACSAFDRKPCIMAPKSDTLFKHDGKRTAKKRHAPLQGEER